MTTLSTSSTSNEMRNGTGTGNAVGLGVPTSVGSLGKYDLLEVLGHGTSGVVYHALDRLLQRHVALKEIRIQGEEMERVLGEARLLHRLRHPNIVAVHSVDSVDNRVLIDMELVEGQNLADVLKSRQNVPLPLEETVRVVLSVLDALAYAHQQRVVHRDIKPANILIGDDGQVKLTDFGLAEVLGTVSVASGGGTYPYMAPENFATHAASDYRADLWAVGVLLYELLVGRRPFSASDFRNPFAWKEVIENDDPVAVTELRPNLPLALNIVLAHALEKNKLERYQSAGEFAAALYAVVPVEMPVVGGSVGGGASSPSLVAPSRGGLSVADIASPRPPMSEDATVIGPSRPPTASGRPRTSAGASVRQTPRPKARATGEVVDVDVVYLARPVMRAWFWPLFAVCLAPPAAVLAPVFMNASKSTPSMTHLLVAWAMSGLLSAMLLMVGIGANLPNYARFLAVVPVGCGVVAYGVLAKRIVSVLQTTDDMVRLAALLLIPLSVLLLQAATAARLWRLWVMLLVLLSGLFVLVLMRVVALPLPLGGLLR